MEELYRGVIGSFFLSLLLCLMCLHCLYHEWTGHGRHDEELVCRGDANTPLASATSRYRARDDVSVFRPNRGMSSKLKSVGAWNVSRQPIVVWSLHGYRLFTPPDKSECSKRMNPSNLQRQYSIWCSLYHLNCRTTVVFDMPCAIGIFMWVNNFDVFQLSIFVLSWTCTAGHEYNFFMWLNTSDDAPNGAFVWMHAIARGSLVGHSSGISRLQMPYFWQFRCSDKTGSSFQDENFCSRKATLDGCYWWSFSQDIWNFF